MYFLLKCGLVIFLGEPSISCAGLRVGRSLRRPLMADRLIGPIEMPRLSDWRTVSFFFSLFRFVESLVLFLFLFISVLDHMARPFLSQVPRYLFRVSFFFTVPLTYNNWRNPVKLGKIR